MVTLNRRKRRELQHYSPVKRNNRKSGGSYIQAVYSKENPRKIFLGRYITEHMLAKATEEGLTTREALVKYGKNRYKINLEAKPVKFIKHRLI